MDQNGDATRHALRKDTDSLTDRCPARASPLPVPLANEHAIFVHGAEMTLWLIVTLVGALSTLRIPQWSESRHEGPCGDVEEDGGAVYRGSTVRVVWGRQDHRTKEWVKLIA